MIAIAHGGLFDIAVTYYIQTLFEYSVPEGDKFSYNLGFILLIVFTIVDIYAIVIISTEDIEKLEI